MNTHKKRQISHLVTTLVAGLACSANAHAVDIYWTGGTDANLSTAANWQGGLVPITGTDARLIFDAATVGAGSFAVTNDLVPDAPVYGALQFNNGGFTVAGSQIALRPYSTSSSYYTEVISNLAGNNIITAPLRIDPNKLGLVLSDLDDARISVSAGSLTLEGAVTASEVKLTTSLGSGASLTMNSVSAKSFVANGGTQNLLGVLDSKTITLQPQTNFIVGGSGGAINATGGTVSLGSLSSLASGTQLTLDNTATASSNRLSGNLTLFAGATFLLKGNATTDVAQNAGVLTVTGSNTALSHIKVEGAGANASMTFNSLSSSGLVNFASSGTLGGAEQIKFVAAPTLTNGLMSRALVNGHEFASYNANGVIAATTATTLSGATAADHVYLGAAESVAGNSAINSLAVNNAVITGGSAINLASGKLLSNGVVNIAPAINFGSSAGEIINMGTTVLAGGVNGSNGLSVIGAGSLELASAGSLTGAFAHNGQLVLSADNALQGASVTSYSGLDIGATTQHLDSFTGGTSNNALSYSALIVGSGVSGTGRLVAANNISLNQDLVNFSLEGANVTVLADSRAPYVTQTTNGNIHASQSVTLDGTMNGVISGSARVIASTTFASATLTNQNTYTGLTTGRLTLSGNGAIAASSGFSGSYLAMRVADGDVGALDRIGDTTAVTLNYGTLSLQSTGNVALSEDIGALNITSSSLLRMSNDTGSTSLRADALNMASGSTLTVSLGNASNFYVDAAPIVYSGTNVVKNVYAEKSIDGKLLPSWAAYDASNGRISEALVIEKALNSAGVDEFVRVTDAANQTLTTDLTVGGVNVDTTQTMSGNGTLTVRSGQLLFWKDNTINISTLNFGINQGVVTNAGTNTIASEIAGSNGLLKKGEGTLVLTGNNIYTGTTHVENGVLSVASGGRIGDVRVTGGQLDLAGTAKIIYNYGTVNLNTAYVNAAGIWIDGGGAIYANAGLTNQGTINGVVNNASSVVNSGHISTVYNHGSLTNTSGASIGHLGHDSNAAFLNSGSIGYLRNSATVVNGGTVDRLSNSGTFTNNGTLILDQAELGGTVVNSATAILNKGYSSGSSFGQGNYKQTAGTTTINGDLYGDMQLEGGILKGTGRIFGNLTVLNGAQVKPGNSPGLLEVTGDVSLARGSVLDMEVTNINGVLVYDQLVVTGSLINNGQIKFSLGAGVSFINGGFASNDQTIVLADIFSTNLLPGLGDGNLLVADTTGFTQSLTVTADGNLAAVPEPETYAMMLVGLGLVGWSVRRRKAKAMQ